MSKPWEMKDYSEMESRLAAARELRRELLGPWVVASWRAMVKRIARVAAEATGAMRTQERRRASGSP
jgi:hypothetical protein